LEPSRNGSLADLLDRILVKGVVLHADLVISVSGVPLIGVNLRAAIAGMKTMLDYGMMEAWDQKIREYALESDEEEPPLDGDEEMVYKTFASLCWGDISVSGVWRPGYLYLTNKRLFLFRRKPAKILFQVALHEIKGLTIEREKYLRQEEECLLLFVENGQSNSVALLRTDEMREIERMIEERIKVASASRVNRGKQAPTDS